MNRRSLLVTLPAALAVGAAPAVALPESPIATLHREITRRQALMDGDHGMSDDEFEDFNMATVDLAEQIVDLPARNTDDMLRKIMGYTINGDHDLSETKAAHCIWAEARALLGDAV